jgi:hypothetical protein
MADPSVAAASTGPTALPPLKKGALVRLSRTAFTGSLEAAASDPEPPAYVFEGPGELLAVRGAYGQIHWSRPVPDVWLRLDQLEPYPTA